MINTKENSAKMTPDERKQRVQDLRGEHEDYLESVEGKYQYIPKMAYRPTGKDELFISFFPSELQKSKDIYTEFVSIDYESEDPKRTLYLWEYNAHWEEEYELIESSSGFQRHIIPVAELKVINDINSRNPEIPQKLMEIKELEQPVKTEDAVQSELEFQLKRIADSLENITYYIKKMN